MVLFTTTTVATTALAACSSNASSSALAACSSNASSSLAVARALRAPVASRTRNGDVEGVEFWDRNAELLEAARLELGPRHGYVYDPSPEQMFEPAVVEALLQKQRGGKMPLRLLAEATSVRGVFAVKLLKDEFVRDLKEELCWLRESGIPLRRPNGMNRYGCILSQLGFQEGTLARLGDVARTLGLALFPDALRDDDVTDLYGFSVRYDLDGDRHLDEHADGAALTMNVCLGGGEERDDDALEKGQDLEGFKGGDLLFRGVRFHEDDAHTQPQRPVRQRRGVALLHLGQHLHAAAPLTAGSRENLVLWATGSGGYVRVLPYTGGPGHIL